MNYQFIKTTILNITTTLLIFTCIAVLTYIIWHEAGSASAIAICWLLIWHFATSYKQKEIDDKYDSILYDEEQLKKLRELN